MIRSKHISAAFLVTIVTLTISIKVNAQVSDSIAGAHNTINAYVGLFDFDINYERNIIQKTKSYSNVRVGLGRASFFVAGEGKYFNAALVHLIGVKNSHMEIDLGIKYMLTNSITNPTLSDNLIPDIFLGYRYEKPSEGFIFRAGLSYPTILNLGVGYKF